MTRTGWLLGSLLALVVLAGVAQGQPGDPSVKLGEITVEPGQTTTVQIKTSGAAKYRAELIDTPTRLVIDLDDTVYVLPKTPVKVSGDPIKQIRASQYRKNVSRVVIQFARKVDYEIVESPAGLSVIVKAPTVAAGKAAVARRDRAPAGPAKPEAAKRPAAPETGAPAAKAEAVKPEKPGPPAAEKPAPRKPVAAAPKARRPAGPKLEVAPVTPPAPPEVAQAQPPAPAPAPAPPSNGRRLISFDFRDADIVNLLRILAAESGRNIVIGEDVKGKMSITLHNVPWDVALETILEARGLQRIERDNLTRIVSNEQLTREREAAARLEETKRKAEADVRQKTAEAELKERELAQKIADAEAARAEAEAHGPIVEDTIRLSYADPVDVANTLGGILGIPVGTQIATPREPAFRPLTPGMPPIIEPPFSQLYGTAPPAGPRLTSAQPAELLAKGITIQPHSPTNSIFIRYWKNDLERIKKLVRETLDIPLPQVKIEARLESLDRFALENLGIQWGGATAGVLGNTALVGQGVTQAVPASGGGLISPSGAGIPFIFRQRESTSGFGSTGIGNPFFQLGTVEANPNAAGTFQSTGGLLPVSRVTGLPTGGSLINLPVSTLGGALISSAPTAGLSFGIIGTRFNVNLALQALAEQQKTRTLARPEIVTVENNKATIQLGREIPYATVSSAGTQVQFRNAVLGLQVTPVVIREGDVTKIKMTVLVENNTQGVDTQAGPTINKQSAETQVIVKEGEHLVIGGVGNLAEVNTIRKVPLFGDIPLFGWLFKQRGTRETSSELVVFITPSVLRQGPPAAQPAPAR